MVGVKNVFGITDDKTFFDQWWVSLTKIINLGGGNNFSERVVNFLYWGLSVAFSGTIIAFLAAKVSNFITNFNKGKSTVLDTNHYVIIGWNSNIFQIFNEIQAANLNQSKPTVLCFNGMDNEVIRTKIDTEAYNFKNLRIVTRSGDIYSVPDLMRTNAKNAKVVIILDDSVKEQFNIETTILATKKCLDGNKTPVIVQFSDDENIKILSELMDNQMFPIHKNNIISNITSQSIRNKHISTVVLDFLDYDGDEIYFKKEQSFVGLTFKQAMVSLKSVMLIGLISNEDKVSLNPDKNYIIRDDDTLIIIAEDDDKDLNINYDSLHNKELFSASSIKPNLNTNPNEQSKSILVIGWSKLGQQVLNKTIDFLGEDSKIFFLYKNDFILNKPIIEQNNTEIFFTEIIDNTHDKLTNCLMDQDFDVILILGYDDYYSSDVSDTISMMQNLSVKSLLNKKGTSYPTRIILQLNDGSKKYLISDNNENEFIVSDLLSSLLITQLADNPKLWYVFEELFGNNGLKINIKHSDYYPALDKEVISVEDLLISALLVDETFIGYIENKQCYLNPEKSKIINDLSDTEFIVIG